MLSNKFICAGQEFSTYKNYVASPLFRKIFVIQDEPQTGTLTIGCAGFYDVYINGKKITSSDIALDIIDDSNAGDEVTLTIYIRATKKIRTFKIHYGK
mgnify:CR=1 FL=1